MSDFSKRLRDDVERFVRDINALAVREKLVQDGATPEVVTGVVYGYIVWAATRMVQRAVERPVPLPLPPDSGVARIAAVHGCSPFIVESIVDLIAKQPKIPLLGDNDPKTGVLTPAVHDLYEWARHYDPRGARGQVVMPERRTKREGNEEP